MKLNDIYQFIKFNIRELMYLMISFTLIVCLISYNYVNIDLRQLFREMDGDLNKLIILNGIALFLIFIGIILSCRIEIDVIYEKIEKRKIISIIIFKILIWIMIIFLFFSIKLFIFRSIALVIGIFIIGLLEL